MNPNVTKQDWIAFIKTSSKKELDHILRCINDLWDYEIFDSALDEINIRIVVNLIKDKLSL